MDEAGAIKEKTGNDMAQRGTSTTDGPVRLAGNCGFPAHELREIEKTRYKA
jgi:hypothetical protein